MEGKLEKKGSEVKRNVNERAGEEKGRDRVQYYFKVNLRNNTPIIHEQSWSDGLIISAAPLIKFF